LFGRWSWWLNLNMFKSFWFWKFNMLKGVESRPLWKVPDFGYLFVNFVFILVLSEMQAAKCMIYWCL
jgi:hypothetical protein